LQWRGERRYNLDELKRLQSEKMKHVWADVSRSFAENQELEGNVGYRESSLKTIFILRWDGSHSMVGEK
jgi:hypothetical protein